jgi:hypothetical protein
MTTFHRACGCVFAAIVMLGVASAAWSQPYTGAQSPPPDLVSAQEPVPAPKVTWNAGAAFTSLYVWRGFVVADTPCVQPMASVSIGSLTATSWVNLIINGSSQGWSEHNLIIDYTGEAGPWLFSAGYTNFYFPTQHNAHASNEFYAGAGYSGPLNVLVRIYHDIQRGDGTYLSAGVSRTVSRGASRWSVTPAVTLGYNHHQWVEGSGWSDLNVSVTLSLPLGSHADVAGALNHSRSLHADWFPSRTYASMTVTLH